MAMVRGSLRNDDSNAVDNVGYPRISNLAILLTSYRVCFSLSKLNMGLKMEHSVKLEI